MINQTKGQDKFLNYINDYIVFLDEMIEIQKRQLNAVISTKFKDTEKIKEADKTVVEIQSYSKRMAVMEEKRLAIQEEVGYGSMTFGEIIEFVEDQKKQEYSILLERFKKTIDNIVFYSKTIQEKVSSDLSLYNGIISQPSSYNSNKEQSNINRFGSTLNVNT